MNIVRITAATMLLICAGCVSEESDVGEVPRPSTPCRKPTFWIWFHPEYRGGDDPDITITELDGDVTVEVGDVERVIPRTGEYAQLRDMILRSPQWREDAETPYSPMPWSGPPRDILTIRHRESGLNLQGERVPAEWKKRILRLSRGVGTTEMANKTQ
ncbi:MAG: hypothetical protein KDN19_18865 [Verrucomicrobiae bacterium]|nr:hypothetical protein [Verrucomicrobiae bacterium]